MKTKHQLIFSNSKNMSHIKNESVDLIVTSPPYPMIQMWDSLFNNITQDLNQTTKKPKTTFELMHKELDKVWVESHRVLKKGGFACINIGDATRTIDNHFQLYSNHARITSAFSKLGFTVLPLILWHKKANTPNKFMGSGMLPAGAYVTLEHEYILIFRKGDKRQFKTEQEKALRKKSAFFWEERNKWFSDIWFGLPGISQNMGLSYLRKRSAAFPIELAYRLICMYSVQSDTVLDPFGGTGTTTLATMALGRNSISIEIDKSFKNDILKRLKHSQHEINHKNTQRLLDHIEFIKNWTLKKSNMKYKNLHYGFPVMTKQEVGIQIPYVESIQLSPKQVIFVNHTFLSKIKTEEKWEKQHNNQEQITMSI